MPQTDSGFKVLPFGTILEVPEVSHIISLSTDTVVFTGPGEFGSAYITVAGGTTGSLYDAATIAGANAGNKICNVTNGVVAQWPCSNGLVYRPAAGETVSISYTSIN